MFLPVPYLAFLAVVAAVAIVWGLLVRARVTTVAPPVAMMAQRIAFPGGVHLHDPGPALARLDQPDEIVIPFEHAMLVIDYPLSNPATMEIDAPLPIGFTRAALVRAICDEYAHVYDAEEGTASTKTIPMDERGELRNRNRTDGAYGIWGHDLEDLVLTAARWSRQADGTVQIELHVES